jgi:hypothetical protein
MEMIEKPTTAEDCAAYFSRTTRDASAHFCVDNNSIVQCVDLRDVAWAAPGANHNGVQIEHAGFAKQTTYEWKDPYGLEMLRRSAKLTAWICRTGGIPPVRLGASDLLHGLRGITGHADVSAAFRRSSHYDPGTGFPWDWYLAEVKSAMGAGVTTKPAPSQPSDIVMVGGKAIHTRWKTWSPCTVGTRFYAENIAVQWALNGYNTALGLGDLDLDGVFGNATLAKVKAFQHWRGLARDGVVGKATAGRLALYRP